MAARGRKKPEPVPVQEEVKPPEKPVIPPGLYARAVYLFPYKNQAFVQTLQSTLESLNRRSLQIEAEGRRALAARILSPQEEANPTLDIITGFEIIDTNVRMYVFEGLFTGLMREFTDMVPKTEHNQDMCKTLINTELKFDERLYVKFGPDFRRIRLREPLEQILLNPDVYIRSKVSEQLLNTLERLMDIRRSDRLKHIKEFNLCPSLEDLLLLERKYGEALTEEDITGVPKKPKVTVVANAEGENETAPAKTRSKSEEKQQNQREKMIIKAELDQENPGFEALLQARAVIPPTNFKAVNKKKVALLSQQTAETRPKDYIQPDLPQGDVYIYSGQRLNFTEHLKSQVLQDMQHRTDTHFTASKDYLSLAWPKMEPDDLMLAERKKFSGTRLRYK